MEQDNKQNTYEIEVEDARITFPDGSTLDTKVVTRRGELPYNKERQIAYENLINESRAVPDFQFWTSQLKPDINRLERDTRLSKSLALSKSKRNYTVALRVERYTDLLFLDANHWYESLESTGFPRAIRREIRTVVDDELKTLVRHLRNLREHQKDVHFYFSSSKPIPHHRELKSVRWFKERYPDSTPWDLFYPGGHKEMRIAGVFRISKLKTQIERVESVIY